MSPASGHQHGHLLLALFSVFSGVCDFIYKLIMLYNTIDNRHEAIAERSYKWIRKTYGQWTEVSE